MAEIGKYWVKIGGKIRNIVKENGEKRDFKDPLKQRPRYASDGQISQGFDF